jgi:hypothetical protein
MRDIATAFGLRFLAMWHRHQRGLDVNAYLFGETP